MNAVLASRFAGESPLGHAFVWATLVAEGALLVVAAQAGFLDGPRVLANMANDSWVPHRFAGSYGGLGIHTVLNIFRAFPGHFRNIVFISVGVIDSGGFKGEESIEELRKATEETAQRYLLLAARLGIPATSRIGLGIDTVEEAEKVCLGVRGDFPNVTFFAGKVIFEEEHWYQKLLHNETAFAIQKRLQWDGETMVILPARVNV